LLTYLLLLQLM